jgi:hypothetical protein
MVSTMRRIAGVAAFVGAGVTLQGCSSGGYKIKEKEVYSNSKYLADFQHDMDLKTCKKLCSNWKKECPDACEKDKKCALTDDVDARHYSREESCKKECVGFNMHGESHCTLFADNVDLLEGGRGTFYLAGGADLGCDDNMSKGVKTGGKKNNNDHGGNNNNNNNGGNNNNNGGYGNNNNNNNNNNGGYGNNNNNGGYGNNNNNGGYGNNNNNGGYGDNNNNNSYA